MSGDAGLFIRWWIAKKSEFARRLVSQIETDESRRACVTSYRFVRFHFFFGYDEGGQMCHNVDLEGHLQSFASVGSIGVNVVVRGSRPATTA